MDKEKEETKEDEHDCIEHLKEGGLWDWECEICGQPFSRGPM